MRRIRRKKKKVAYKSSKELPRLVQSSASWFKERDSNIGDMLEACFERAEVVPPFFDLTLLSYRTLLETPKIRVKVVQQLLKENDPFITAAILIEETKHKLVDFAQKDVKEKQANAWINEEIFKECVEKTRQGAKIDLSLCKRKLTYPGTRIEGEAYMTGGPVLLQSMFDEWKNYFTATKRVSVVLNDSRFYHCFEMKQLCHSLSKILERGDVWYWSKSNPALLIDTTLLNEEIGSYLRSRYSGPVSLSDRQHTPCVRMIRDVKTQISIISNLEYQRFEYYSPLQQILGKLTLWRIVYKEKCIPSFDTLMSLAASLGDLYILKMLEKTKYTKEELDRNEVKEYSQNLHHLRNSFCLKCPLFTACLYGQYSVVEHIANKVVLTQDLVYELPRKVKRFKFGCNEPVGDADQVRTLLMTIFKSQQVE